MLMSRRNRRHGSMERGVPVSGLSLLFKPELLLNRNEWVCIYQVAGSTSEPSVLTFLILSIPVLPLKPIALTP